MAQSGPDGLFLVDDNFTVFYPRIRAALRQISDRPVRIIVNTHSHFDHNQNNANFAKLGALIFSSQPAHRADAANASTGSAGRIAGGDLARAHDVSFQR